MYSPSLCRIIRAMTLGCKEAPPFDVAPQTPSEAASAVPPTDPTTPTTSTAPTTSTNSSGKMETVLAGCIEPCLLIAADAAAAASAVNDVGSAAAAAQGLAAEAISALSSCVQVSMVAAGGRGELSVLLHCIGGLGKGLDADVVLAGTSSILVSSMAALDTRSFVLRCPSSFAAWGRSDLGPGQAGRRSEGPCVQTLVR